jgi:hypothetical protein
MEESPGPEKAPAPCDSTMQRVSEGISCKHARIQSVTKETHEERGREN